MAAPSLPLYEALFETAPDAMLVVDDDGTMLLANPQCASLFGYAGDELIGKPVELLMPGPVRGAHRSHRQAYVAAPRVRPMGAGQDLVGRRQDGTLFPVEIALSPVSTAEGTYVVASIRDVSATRRERQAWARARLDAVVARLGQLALESSGSDVIEQTVPGSIATALDADAVALLLAEAGSDRVVLRSSSGLDAPLCTLVPWSTAPPNPLGHVLTERASLVVPDFDALGDLTPHPALYEAGFRSSLLVPLLDRGRPLGALVVLWRTPHGHDRDALHFVQSVATIVSACVQRARSDRQLAHSQRLDALGQLTGGIAHDFNNLLTVISGNLQLLEARDGVDAEAAELIGDALHAVSRGAELTAKLLGFARGMKLSPRKLAPLELIVPLAKMLARTLGEHIELRISHPDALPLLVVDAAQLESALLNLALNARDAMPRGGRLTIALREEMLHEGERALLAPGHYVVFSVVDSGLGMSAKVLARAFEPFFTTKDAGKGTGLGLSTVFGFARQSGGTLAVESALGFGTRAELWLPAAAHPAGDVEATPAQAAGEDAGALVLVVEDEADVRRIASAFLRDAGYQVLQAPDAMTALDIIGHRDDIAVLFTDLVLGPGRSGRELALEAVRQRPCLRVLLTTGYDSGAAGAEADQAWETLAKPYRREQLVQALARALAPG